MFASTAIHIRVKHSIDGNRIARQYSLLVCENTCEHVEIPRRYTEHYYHPKNARARGCTIFSNATTPVTPLNISLGLLQTSRQIYHEAVLKPFSETSFHYQAFTNEKVCGLQKFTEALAPPQAKAIARLRLIFRHTYWAKDDQTPPSLRFGVIPGKSTILRLKGLKDLQIVLAPRIVEKKAARRYLALLSQSLPNSPGIIALSDLRLRSLRVTVEGDFGKGEDVRDTWPTFAARGEREEVEQWLRRFELELHVGFLVDTDLDPMPPFAIKQNDDAIRIPPWSTDEALETARVERARNVEIRRLENEAFQIDQEDCIRAGHPPPWTLEEMERMAESARYGVMLRIKYQHLRD